LLPVEGSVFAVPLQPSGFAVGVLARVSGKGRAFGYFFGPRVPRFRDVKIDELRPEIAAMVCKFGDYGLVNQKWPVIGQVPNWMKARWELPRFTREHDHADKSYLVEYDDCLNAISERIVPRDSDCLKGLPYDSQLGSGIVEARLSKLLPIAN